MVIGACIACILLVSGAQAAEFIPLGELPGGETRSEALEVSDDGSVVVGTSLGTVDVEAFRWTAETGMVGLGSLPGGVTSLGLGVSGDGITVVGLANSTEAFRWTIAEKMIGLGDLPGGLFDSSAEGASADGSVVVGRGHSDLSDIEAFRWTSDGGMVGLGVLAGGGRWSRALATSADGSVVVGYGQSFTDNSEAFRWTKEGGMIGLGYLPGGEPHSRAFDVSADGSVVVGYGWTASRQEAYRWTSNGGMVGLGAFLDGDEFLSYAYGVSADGKVVVGNSNTDSGSSEAFVWTEASGMVRLHDILVANGATGLSDWGRLKARGISGDGKWVVGRSVNPSGDTEAFLARIDGDIGQGFEINAGHAGAWFNPDTSGQGQFIDVVPKEQLMFISWFTFTDAASNNPDEQQWYTAQGNYAGNTAVLDLFETLGGKFDDPQEVTTTPIGEVTLTFSDCDMGMMSYRFDEEELQGEFPLIRVIGGSGNVCEQFSGNTTQAVAIKAGMDGAWFDPDTSGQGYFIDAHPDPEGGNFIFVSWFTYGISTASGQRWLTAQGGFEGSSAEIDVFETTGGSFDDPEPADTTKVGTMNLDFTDCSNAQMTYSLPADPAEGDITITRVIPGSQALCEELTGVE